VSDSISRWWKETYERDRARYGERRERFETSSGIEVRALYTNRDRDPDTVREPGLPGEYPFTRGIRPTMYRGRLWTMRQYAGFGSSLETNRRFRYLLAQGQTGLSVAFDLPTQMGYDSDHPVARGEVGRVGVAIDSLEDMRVLFEDIPLDQVSTSMTINATAAVLLCLYVALADERGIPRERLAGTVQNDILKEYIARGTYIYPPRPSLRLVTDVVAWCRAELPRWNTISISGYHVREAGATAAQEVAFTLGNAAAYVEAALAAGLALDEFAARFSFFFNVHNHFFEEVAKFRAARRLWARLVRERFGGTHPSLQKLRFHAQTAGSTLTAQQPENNVTRVALQALAAVLGGCQSLHTNSMDEALSLPGEKAARIALRTQQIIAEETGVADSVDPLGGSHLVESWTDEIENRARELLDRIDGMGGMVRSIEEGFPQAEIERASYRYQREIEEGRRVVVGVNRYRGDEAPDVPAFRLDPEVSKDQRRRLEAHRASRDGEETKRCLKKLEDAAGGETNLVPLILESVKAGATLGEISAALEREFGRFRPGV
jgi:methylmalonyl-CoA mutase N-terminal domain/subunit